MRKVFNNSGASSHTAILTIKQSINHSINFTFNADLKTDLMFAQIKKNLFIQHAIKTVRQSKNNIYQ